MLEDLEELLTRWQNAGTSVDEIVTEVEAVLDRLLDEENRRKQAASAFHR